MNGDEKQYIAIFQRVDFTKQNKKRISLLTNCVIALNNNELWWYWFFFSLIPQAESCVSFYGMKSSLRKNSEMVH